MSTPLPPDPYVVLGVSKDFTQDGLKKAHRNLVLRTHPDKVQDSTLRTEYLEKFQQVQQAYELLSDPSRRQTYDDQVKLSQYRAYDLDQRRPSSTRNDGASPVNGKTKPPRTEYVAHKSYEARRPTYYKEYDYFEPKSSSNRRSAYYEEYAFGPSAPITRTYPVHAGDTKYRSSSFEGNPPSTSRQKTRPKMSRGRQQEPQGLYSTPGNNQSRTRARSVASNVSSRNSSLGGGRHFERDYQQPEFSRRRAGSGSDYEIRQSSPGLPPRPTPRPTTVRSPSVYDSRGARELPRQRSPLPSANRKGDNSNHARIPQLSGSVFSSSDSENEIVGLSKGSDSKSANPVECYICGNSVTLYRNRTWQKHVLKDLRPYQCLEEDCMIPDATYASLFDLHGHYSAFHPQALIRSKVTTCVFCGDNLNSSRGENLKHVGRHMEDIAFAVIARPYEDWEFYSESASGSSPDVPRVPRYDTRRRPPEPRVDYPSKDQQKKSEPEQAPAKAKNTGVLKKSETRKTPSGSAPSNQDVSRRSAKRESKQRSSTKPPKDGLADEPTYGVYRKQYEERQQQQAREGLQQDQKLRAKSRIPQQSDSRRLSRSATPLASKPKVERRNSSLAGWKSRIRPGSSHQSTGTGANDDPSKGQEPIRKPSRSDSV